MNFFRNSAVHAHYFLVDNCYEWHVIEAVVEGLPQGDIIPSFNFIEEAIHSCDGLTLVVSSKYNDLLRIPHFESEQ